jgi:hypothetical protein
LARESSSSKLHIRINWITVDGYATWLPPMQMKVIPVCQGKTPAAQMHFVSELTLSKASLSING